MRMVDLRSTGPTNAAPTVEVLSSGGAELLRLIGVLLSTSPGDFDVGADRLLALRERLGTTVLEQARALSKGLDNGDEAQLGDDMAFYNLSLLGAVLPEPGGAEELLTRLREEPTLAWRVLAARHLDDLLDDAADLRRRLTIDEPGAIDEVHALDLTAAREPVAHLLHGDPEAYGRALHEVVERVATELWPRLLEESMGPIERDVAHRRALLDAGTDPAQVVLEATNGYELADEPAGRRVVLLPSYWLRPWLVVGELEGLDVEVVSTVVADTFLALPSEAPPPSLLKLFKALSDEGRLKLLRRMTSGPVSLAEATEELGVTKATAHHHLSILRQSGLVSMGGEGRATRYSLRDDPASVTHEALTRYVPSRR